MTPADLRFDVRVTRRAVVVIAAVSAVSPSIIAAIVSLFGQVGYAEFRTTLQHMPNWQTRPLEWPCPNPADWPAAPNLEWWAEGSGLSWTCAKYFDWEQVHDCLLRVDVVRSGWPFRSMMAWHRTDDREGRVIVTPTNGVELSAISQLPPMHRDTSVVEPRVLPLRVIPAGYAIDAGIAFVALYVPTAALGALRARRRRWRGACAACGYDLAGVARCPECGTVAT